MVYTMFLFSYFNSIMNSEFNTKILIVSHIYIKTHRILLFFLSD